MAVVRGSFRLDFSALMLPHDAVLGIYTGDRITTREAGDTAYVRNRICGQVIPRQCNL